MREAAGSCRARAAIADCTCEARARGDGGRSGPSFSALGLGRAEISVAKLRLMSLRRSSILWPA